MNPPHLAHRRASSESLCAALGLTIARFSEGVSGHADQLACTLAHRKAMNSANAWPYLILEDDLELAGQSNPLPPFPDDADIIYLSATPFGCLPWTYENLAIARHQAIQGRTLASRYDDDWLKLHSMSGGQTILYVSE